MKQISFATHAPTELVDLTSRVREAIQSSCTSRGLCFVYSPHTTAGVILNSASDPETVQDILDDLDRLVPTRVNFKHTLDTPGDAAGHVKLALIGNSVLVPVVKHELALGHSQSILFFEFDGPRDREVYVAVVATANNE
ncbi:MAG: secondary thiamine-phosphate synthase enzyme YjbQ [Ardenticatenaceae bacterium]|nr:secondary thiamine-phosphate synthase enzyme YjbQ [Ardenticatenaceae bacterium]